MKCIQKSAGACKTFILLLLILIAVKLIISKENYIYSWQLTNKYKFNFTFFKSAQHNILGGKFQLYNQSIK